MAIDEGNDRKTLIVSFGFRRLYKSLLCQVQTKLTFVVTKSVMIDFQVASGKKCTVSSSTIFF